MLLGTATAIAEQSTNCLSELPRVAKMMQMLMHGLTETSGNYVGSLTTAPFSIMVSIVVIVAVFRFVCF